MSTLDREPRKSQNAHEMHALSMKRVDPGTIAIERRDGPSLLTTKPPRGQNNLPTPGRMPVKR